MLSILSPRGQRARGLRSKVEFRRWRRKHTRKIQKKERNKKQKVDWCLGIGIHMPICHHINKIVLKKIIQ